MTDIQTLRREPPAFRRVAVGRIEDLTPHLRRFTFVGEELDGLVIDDTAASVRLLIPSPGTDNLVMPEWTGNEFLLSDNRRPLIRTFTPRFLRDRELDLDVVLHGEIGASGWAIRVGVGDPAAISGPGRGYEIDPGADPLILLGDETATPAIAQILERTPSQTRIVAHVEVARPGARLAMPEHPNATLTWHDLGVDEAPGTTLLSVLEAMDLSATARVWAAGEAAGVQRLRKHLVERGIDRSRTTVRGYWKVGRAGPGI